MKKAFVLIITICLAAAAFAAENVPAPPAAPAGSAKLSRLIGTWSGEAQNQEAGKPATTVRVKVDCRASSGGWGVKCDVSFVSPEMNYLEADLFGYDANANKVHMFTVTNAGEVHDHTGTWIDDSRLKVRFEGNGTAEDITLAFLSQNKMAFDATTNVNGALSSTLKGSVQRR